MKKHNILKVVLITFLVGILLTWIFPITYFNGAELAEDGRHAVGIFTLMNYIVINLANFSEYALYILSIGCLYAVLNRIPGYKHLIQSIAKSYKDREWVFLCLAMFVITVFSCVCGMDFAIIFIFPFVISVVLALGYSKITAALVTVGSVAVGLIGSMFNAQTIYGAVYSFSTSGKEFIGANGYIKVKLLVLLVSFAILVFNVLFYAKKNKKTENVYELMPKEEIKANGKRWPIVLVLDIIFVILVLGFTTWTGMDDSWTFFDEALTSLNSNKNIVLTFFSNLLGLSKSFGYWTFNEASVLVFVASIVLALCYKVRFNDFFDICGEGIKKALKPAGFVFLAFTMLVLSNSTPVLCAIYKPILGIFNGFNAVTLSIVAFISNTFNVTELYSSTSTLPYVLTIVTGNNNMIGAFWQSMFGLSALFVPTSLTLVSTLSYMNVSFGQWFKGIWKFLLELYAALLIVFTVISLL